MTTRTSIRKHVDADGAHGMVDPGQCGCFLKHGDARLNNPRQGHAQCAEDFGRDRSYSFGDDGARVRYPSWYGCLATALTRADRCNCIIG